MIAERIDNFNVQYDAEVLGFCFDTGHANLTSLDFSDFIECLGSGLKVLYIHANDDVSFLVKIGEYFTRELEIKIHNHYS